MGCGCSVCAFFCKWLWGALAFFGVVSVLVPHLASGRRLCVCFCLSLCVLALSLDFWPEPLTLCFLAEKFVHLDSCAESLGFKYLFVGKECKILMEHSGTLNQLF